MQARTYILPDVVERLKQLEQLEQVLEKKEMRTILAALHRLVDLYELGATKISEENNKLVRGLVLLEEYGLLTEEILNKFSQITREKVNSCFDTIFADYHKHEETKKSIFASHKNRIAALQEQYMESITQENQKHQGVVVNMNNLFKNYVTVFLDSVSPVDTAVSAQSSEQTLPSQQKIRNKKRKYVEMAGRRLDHQVESNSDDDVVCLDSASVQPKKKLSPVSSPRRNHAEFFETFSNKTPTTTPYQSPLNKSFKGVDFLVAAAMEAMQQPQFGRKGSSS